VYGNATPQSTDAAMSVDISSATPVIRASIGASFATVIVPVTA
jgi:hypothetical protein